MNIIIKIIVIALTVYLLLQVCNQFDYFHHVPDPVLRDIRDQLSVLHEKFKDVKIYEGNKSYTINKEHVYICLKDENGRYYNRNMLVYVVLHEYAHILSNTIGHGGEFPEVFNKLLKRAAEMGLYDPSQPLIKNYCGHN